MRYYKNSSGDVAKVMQTGARVVVMTSFKTLFFADSEQARRFLGSRGYF